MHGCEDEASALAAQLGCVTCIIGEEAGTGCNAGNADFAAYCRLYPPLPWPGQVGDSKEQAAAAAARRRAFAAVCGSVVADAAAMGVQWVYDADQLAALEEQRRAQVGGGAGLV